MMDDISKKTKLSAYVAIVAVLVTMATLFFAMYTWNKSQRKNSIEKRTELLQKIGELKAGVVNFRHYRLEEKQEALFEPIPTHIKQNGKCVPLPPKLANYFKVNHADRLKGLDDLITQANEIIAYADQMRNKYSNYDQQFSDEEILIALVQITDKIAMVNVLNNFKPVKLEPVHLDIISDPNATGSSTIPCDDKKAK